MEFVIGKVIMAVWAGSVLEFCLESTPYSLSGSFNYLVEASNSWLNSFWEISPAGKSLVLLCGGCVVQLAPLAASVLGFTAETWASVIPIDPTTGGYFGMGGSADLEDIFRATLVGLEYAPISYASSSSGLSGLDSVNPFPSFEIQGSLFREVLIWMTGSATAHYYIVEFVKEFCAPLYYLWGQYENVWSDLGELGQHLYISSNIFPRAAELWFFGCNPHASMDLSQMVNASCWQGVGYWAFYNLPSVFGFYGPPVATVVLLNVLLFCF